MPKIDECLIGVEVANALRDFIDTLRLKVPKGKLTFLCPHCRKPVRPIKAGTSNGSVWRAHFKHLKHDRECPHSVQERT
jgi:hypothetical protein